jgi:hypothetical protein
MDLVHFERVLREIYGGQRFVVTVEPLAGATPLKL